MFAPHVRARAELGPGACSEFPNDNPALHDGAIWRCDETRGPATCELRIIGVDRGGPEEVGVAVAVEEESAEAMTDTVDATEDPFATLLCLLEEVARASGAREDIGVGLRALLGETRMVPTSLPPSGVEALIAGNCIIETEAGIKRTELFTRTVLAWQGILRGEGEDFSACGSATLDEWAADVLARCMGNPGLAPLLRREMRRRGVAAFGLVSQAA